MSVIYACFAATPTVLWRRVHSTQQVSPVQDLELLVEAAQEDEIAGIGCIPCPGSVARS